MNYSLQFNSLLASDTSTKDKPRYMEIFSKHQHWEGNYMYNSSMYYCYLYAHSEHYLKKDLLLVTFRDKRGVTIELEGGYRHISCDKFEKILEERLELY